MKPDPRIFDDITRMAGGAMNVFSGIREQILNDVKARFDELAHRMNWVPREDFDRLEMRVKELEKKMGAPAPSQKPVSKKVVKKAPTKKPVKKKS